jgi:hypothetical protein
VFSSRTGDTVYEFPWFSHFRAALELMLDQVPSSSTRSVPSNLRGVAQPQHCCGNSLAQPSFLSSVLTMTSHDRVLRLLH